MTGATTSDIVAYVEKTKLIDKFSEMLYSIVRSVKKMYKNIIKVSVIAILVVALNACSSKTYKIKQETDKIVNEVPKWYMADFDVKKHCDISKWANNKIIKNKDDDKTCIFGVGTSVSIT